MKLGGSTKKNRFMDAMTAEDELTSVPPMASSDLGSGRDGPLSGEGNSSEGPTATSSAPTEPIVVTCEEKISCVLTRDGTIDSCDVKGTLFVHANDPSQALVSVHLTMTHDNPYQLNYQCHPKVNKKLFESDRVVALKNATKPFPESRVGVLRWSLKTTDESSLPLSLTCWPEENGDGSFTVMMEYTLEREAMTLTNVMMAIPLGDSCRDVPTVLHVDGNYRHDTQQHQLMWHHTSISQENPTGTLEFKIAVSDVEAFFPTRVSFFSADTYADLTVTRVVGTDTGTDVDTHFSSTLVTESYTVA